MIKVKPTDISKAISKLPIGKSNKSSIFISGFSRINGKFKEYKDIYLLSKLRG
jgi:hypothetical protein